jgi:hypothetical protein
MVVGLAAATLQGAPVVTQDVDLWFRDVTEPGVEKALKKVRGSYLPRTGKNPPMFVGKAVQLFDIVVRMDGLKSFEKEKANLIQVRLGRTKIPILKLERIIASKKAAGRDKDKLVMKALADTLKAVREHSDK